MGAPYAFPSVCQNDPGHPASVPGMTLRDYFAGQALAGLCADGDYMLAAKEMGIGIPNVIATSSYEFADAMLAERAKATGQEGGAL